MELYIKESKVHLQSDQIGQAGRPDHLATICPAPYNHLTIKLLDGYTRVGLRWSNPSAYPSLDCNPVWLRRLPFF